MFRTLYWTLKGSICVTQFVHQFSCSGTHVVRQGRGTDICQAVDLVHKKEMLWDSTNHDYKNQQRKNDAADLQIENAAVENKMSSQSKEN
jgi:DNA-binding protein